MSYFLLCSDPPTPPPENCPLFRDPDLSPTSELADLPGDNLPGGGVGSQPVQAKMTISGGGGQSGLSKMLTQPAHTQGANFPVEWGVWVSCSAFENHTGSWLLRWVSPLPTTAVAWAAARGAGKMDRCHADDFKVSSASGQYDFNAIF